MRVFKARTACSIRTVANDGYNAMICTGCGMKSQTFTEMADHVHATFGEMREHWFENLYYGTLPW